MPDNRNYAGSLLGEAADTILKKRPGVHGDAENSFSMIGDMWTVYLRHTKMTRGDDSILPEDVAEMMSMLKKARKVYGDKSNADNDVDDLGYTALAGMLRKADPIEKMEPGMGILGKRATPTPPQMPAAAPLKPGAPTEDEQAEKMANHLASRRV